MGLTETLMNEVSALAKVFDQNEIVFEKQNQIIAALTGQLETLNDRVESKPRKKKKTKAKKSKPRRPRRRACVPYRRA